MRVDGALVAVALACALVLRPWQLLPARPALVAPLAATLVTLPWLWVLPVLHGSPLQLQWSGAVLVTLMLGWPLAVPVLAAVGALASLLAPVGLEGTLALVAWQGVVPATFTLLLGAALRRGLPHHPFVYVLGRGFLGAALCLFASSLLAQAAGQVLPGIDPAAGLVARWLTAWGDAFVTGILTAVFVAYRPQWLLTWSDRLYLREQK